MTACTTRPVRTDRANWGYPGSSGRFFATAQIAAVFNVLTRPGPLADVELGQAREFLRFWLLRWAELGLPLTVIMAGIHCHR
jgi:hypothetical protein